MKTRIETLEIDSYNEKGYGVGTVGGAICHCLGALPGETVKAKIFKSKKGVLITELEDILTPSPHRIEPKDQAYLSTSPLQICDTEGELIIKQRLINRLFSPFGIEFADIFHNTSQEWGYRNKVEFSFYGHEDETIDLAFHKRGSSKGKIPVKGTSIAHPAINETAQSIVAILNQLKHTYSAFSYKSLIVRYSKETGGTIAVLYCKVDPESDTSFYDELVQRFKQQFNGNIHIVYSDRRSPASILSKKIFSSGDWVLQDRVHGNTFLYPVDSFFQINTTIFEQIITDIRSVLTEQMKDLKSQSLLDAYAGVGTIGMCLADLFSEVHAFEVFPDSKEYADRNAQLNSLTNYTFQNLDASSAGSVFEGRDCVIVDPPRGGLDMKVIETVLAHPSEYLVYVSCNPATQSRDLHSLLFKFDILYHRGYNLYPQTPHLESLVILKRGI